MSGARLLFPDLGPQDVADGWLVDVPQLTSAQVLDAIGRRHPMDGFNGTPGRWVFVREVQASTGSYADVQRFDALAVGLVPSNRYARVVYEVKVSRADWLRELRPMRTVDYRGHSVSRSVVKAHETGDGLDVLRAAGYTVVVGQKWDAALAVSTELWFAAPPRCILPDELPPDAGLVEVRLWGSGREPRAKVVRPATVRSTPNPGAGFWAAVLRKAAAR